MIRVRILAIVVGLFALGPWPSAQAVEAFARESRTIYTPFRAEVLGEASSSDPTALWRASKQDPWDGRGSCEEAFVAKLGAAAPRATVKDLDPVLDAMRIVKSPREIALIREATRIAGLAIIEAMHDARPGIHEYELQADAEFVFKKHGAYGASYFALVATGTNTFYSHYHAGTAVLARRRSGAVRLRARLQVLSVGGGPPTS